MVSASFWGTFGFNEGLSFELFEPSLDGSLRYRKSDSHFTSSLARVGLNVGKKTIYTDIYTDTVVR